MLERIANQEDCIKRWGVKLHSTYNFTRRGWSESPRMVHRIKSLYRKCHQRSFPKSKQIGLAFARGIIAEKRGYLVNWAAFAYKQCHRGKVDIVNSGRKHEEGTEHEGEDDDSTADEDNLEGALDDWDLNRQWKDFPDTRSLPFNIQSQLPQRVLSYGVDRTLYGKAQERQGSISFLHLHFVMFSINSISTYYPVNTSRRIRMLRSLCSCIPDSHILSS